MQPARQQCVYDRATLGKVKLQPDLHPAHLPVQPLYQVQRLTRGREVQGDTQTICGIHRSPV